MKPGDRMRGAAMLLVCGPIVALVFWFFHNTCYASVLWCP